MLVICRHSGSLGDIGEPAAHGFLGLPQRDEKRVARHTAHDRIHHEAQGGWNVTAQRDGFELNVDSIVALFETSDAA